MKKIYITKEDKLAFIETNNGKSKYKWMKVGCFIDILSTLGVAFLFIFRFYLRSYIAFYLLLYALLVITILGGEMIGTYYGALEEYVLHKKEKKEIVYMD